MRPRTWSAGIKFLIEMPSLGGEDFAYYQQIGGHGTTRSGIPGSKRTLPAAFPTSTSMRPPCSLVLASSAERPSTQPRPHRDARGVRVQCRCSGTPKSSSPCHGNSFHPRNTRSESRSNSASSIVRPRPCRIRSTAFSTPAPKSGRTPSSMSSCSPTANSIPVSAKPSRMSDSTSPRSSNGATTSQRPMG